MAIMKRRVAVPVFVRLISCRSAWQTDTNTVIMEGSAALGLGPAGRTGKTAVSGMTHAGPQGECSPDEELSSPRYESSRLV